jgi:hypothetical protein
MADRIIARCTRCGAEVPIDELGSWFYESDGSLMCPDHSLTRSSATLWVEDLFLTDDLEARGFWSVAEWIREAPSHEAVEEIRAGVLRVVALLEETG